MSLPTQRRCYQLDHLWSGDGPCPECRPATDDRTLKVVVDMLRRDLALAADTIEALAHERAIRLAGERA